MGWLWGILAIGDRVVMWNIDSRRQVGYGDIDSMGQDGDGSY